ncbi:hypothetical protein [Methylobacterium segetis]|uniref:hypothetical protein n=1 Tax=Methylobacterium segetis TaxID=2488750 RepID=UPI001042FC71|nr:hypothetical protein [Methylobacterium segetis]
MDLNTYLRTILATNPNDWLKVDGATFLQSVDEITSFSGGSNHSALGDLREHREIATLKSDLSISLAAGLKHRDKFYEPWTKGFADPNASSVFIDALWNGRPVFREIGVYVDGARALLPPPIPGSLEVEADRATFFELVDSLFSSGQHSLYFRQASFTTVNKPWP